MKNKLIAFITTAAVLSLMVSTAAVISCSRAFSKKNDITHASPDTEHRLSDPPITQYYDTDTRDNETIPDTDNDEPAKSAGLSEDALYLLIYENDTLFAFDESGTEIFSAPLNADRLSAAESEMLYGGIMIAGGSALREALEDLLC